MKIAVDVGNTNLKIGYFEKDEFTTKKIRINDEIVNNLQQELNNLDYEEVLYLSVVPSLDHKIKQCFKDASIKELNEFKLDYSNYTNELGLDRKVGMEAVYQLCKFTNFIFIDCGSATTINVVVNKQFQGGVIMPGMGLQYSALNNFTTLTINYDRNKDEKLFGLNTSDNVMSGIYNSIIFSLKGFVEAFNKEFDQQFKVVYTGGNARYFRDNLPSEWLYRPDITMLYLLKKNSN